MVQDFMYFEKLAGMGLAGKKYWEKAEISNYIFNGKILLIII